MQIIQIFLNNSLRNYNYILYSEITKEAIIFDPTDMDLITPVLKKFQLKAKFLLNTHSHADHISGNQACMDIEGVQAIKMRHDETLFLTHSEKVVCKNTPGHVLDHQCYFFYHNEKLKGVITGDTLFNAGVGNCKGGGDPHLLFETIRDIFIPLSDDVLLLPSHDYFMKNRDFAIENGVSVESFNLQVKNYKHCQETQSAFLATMGQERLYNPFLLLFGSQYVRTEKNMREKLFVELRKKRDIF